MPITRYYAQTANNIPPENAPQSEQSTAFPWGTNGTTYTQGPQYCYIDSSPLVTLPGAITTFNALAQTTRQSQICATLLYELGAQTIPQGNWSFAVAVNETNAAANSFFGVAIYVWRPSTSSKVGTITDEQVQRGAEWGTNTSSRLFTVTGTEITTQDGDVLVVEMWRTGVQAMATAYAHTWNFNAQAGNNDFTADGQTNLNSWMDAPEALQPPAGSQLVVPETGLATLTGYVASILLPVLLATGLGTATYTGHEPTVVATNNITVVTDTGTATLDGFAPTVLTPLAIQTNTGTATLDGLEPSIMVSVSAETQTGEATFDGFAPSVATPVVAVSDTGLLTAIGEAPSVLVSDDVAVTTDTGAALLTGYAPTLALPVVVQSDTGIGLYTGQDCAVVLSDNKIAVPGTGELGVDGYAPEVLSVVSVLTQRGQATLDGYAPTVLTPRAVATNTGELNVTGFVPVVRTPVRVLAGVGIVTVDGYEPTVIAIGTGLALTETGEASVSGFAPTLVLPVVVPTSTGTASIDGYEPTLDITQNVWALVGTGQVAADGLVPVIVTPRTIPTDVGSVNATGFAPVVTVIQYVYPGVGHLTINAYAPTIEIAKAIFIRARGFDYSGNVVWDRDLSAQQVTVWDRGGDLANAIDTSRDYVTVRSMDVDEVQVLDSSEGLP